MAEHINPAAIPGDALQPELLVQHADSLSKAASGTRDHGAEVVAEWQKLAAYYTAPEGPQLFAVMTPVGPATSAFGDNLDVVVAALKTFADEVTPIKAELARLKGEAQTFVDTTVANGVDVKYTDYGYGYGGYGASGAYAGYGYNAFGSYTQAAEDNPVTRTHHQNWDENQGAVDKNNSLIAAVSAQQVKLWAAERTCANKIRALFGAEPLRSMQSEDDALGYGLSEIPEGTEMPWGAATKRTEGCAEASLTFVFEDVIWKGIAVGGVWGTITGLGTLLLGYNPATGDFFSGDAYGAAWSGLGMLAFGLATSGTVGIVGSFVPGPVGDFFRGGQEAVVNTLKGVVAWDTWAENPGEALGSSIFNIATIVIPAGAVVGGVKTATGAANALGKAAKIVDMVDPGAWLSKGVLGGSKFIAPSVADLLKSLDFSLGDNMGNLFDGSTLKIANFDGSTFDFTPPKADVPGSFDVPPARGTDAADVPVRVPESVVAGAPGSSQLLSPDTQIGGTGTTVLDTPPGHGAGGATGSGNGTGSGSGTGAGGGSGSGAGTGTGDGSGNGPGSGADGADGVPPKDPTDAADPTDPPKKPWDPEMGDPVLSDADYGPGFERVDDRTGSNPIDPNYGDVRADGTSGHLNDAYAHPGTISDDIAHMIEDPQAPYGRGEDGQPYSREEWESRYTDANGRPIYPGNDGGKVDSFVEFNNMADFKAHYGETLDRFGSDEGKFLSFPEMSFESRSLPPSNLSDTYSTFQLSDELPKGAHIEVSEIAPAFGRDGGGLQVRILDADGTPLSVEDLMHGDNPVLVRSAPGVDGGTFGTPVHITPDASGEFAAPSVQNSVDVPAADVPGSRSVFAAPGELLPDTVYHVEGRGDFYTDASGSVVHVETRYGGTGNLHPDLMMPHPNTTYVVHPDVVNPVDGANHAHVFQTDDQGRTVLAHTDHLSIGDADRSGSVQSRVGNEGGVGYDGGHLFGNGYGGGGEYANTVAMLREINRGGGDSFFNLENQWRALLKADPDVQIEVDIRPHYPADGGRVPSKVEVEFTINGGDPEWKVFKNG